MGDLFIDFHTGTAGGILMVTEEGVPASDSTLEAVKWVLNNDVELRNALEDAVKRRLSLL